MGVNIGWRVDTEDPLRCPRSPVEPAHRHRNRLLDKLKGDVPNTEEGGWLESPELEARRRVANEDWAMDLSVHRTQVVGDPARTVVATVRRADTRRTARPRRSAWSRSARRSRLEPTLRARSSRRSGPAPVANRSAAWARSARRAQDAR